MRHSRGRFQEQQTLIGIGEVNARRARSCNNGGKHLIRAAVHNPFLIVFRIQRSGGQLETSAPLDSTVAGDVVASLACKNAADIVGEVKGARDSGAADFKLSLRAAAIQGSGNR